MKAAIPADGCKFPVKMQQHNLFSSPTNPPNVACCTIKSRISATAGDYTQLRLASNTQLSKRFLPRSNPPVAPALQVFAARRKKPPSQRSKSGGSLKPTPSPTRPPSLFVKQSPVPSRRPLRCVPFSNVLPEYSSSSSPSSSRENKGESQSRRKVASSNAPSTQRLVVEKPKPGSSPPVKEKVPGNKVSKWASLFDAGGGNSGVDSRQESNADAWFDKIFPKSTTSSSTGGGSEIKPSESSGSPRLSPQQEKSIQQLQTLVKTLGVATRNSSGAPGAGATGAAGVRRNNKPNKLRPAPVQGGAVDPVPFSSILKKLQNVSSQESKPQELKPMRFKPEIVDDDEVDDNEEDELDELSGEDDESEIEIAATESSTEQESEVEVEEEEEEEEEEESTAGGQEILAAEKLSKMTVVALRSLAKERGLSGYSKMRKDELVQLLS